MCQDFLEIVVNLKILPKVCLSVCLTDWHIISPPYHQKSAILLILLLFDVQNLSKIRRNTNHIYACILQIVGTLDPRFHDLVRRAEAERMLASNSFSTSDESDPIQALTFDPSPHTGQYVTKLYNTVQDSAIRYVTVRYRKYGITNNESVPSPLIITSNCCYQIYCFILEMYTGTRSTHDSRHMKEGSSKYDSKRSRGAAEDSEGLKNSIRESSCRFLQVLANVDASLFSDCVRHSLLGSHLTANMAAYSAHKKEYNRNCNKGYINSSGRQLYTGGDIYGYEEGRGRGIAHHALQPNAGGDDDDLENGDKSRGGGEGEGHGVGAINEWGGKGGFASFSAQSDLLCVILRAETLSLSSVSSRDTEHEAQGFPSHTPQHSSLSFSKSVRILDPQIPLKLLSAVTSSLNAMASALSRSRPLPSSTQSQIKVLTHTALSWS